MAAASTLEMIWSIPIVDGQHYAEWTREFLDVTSLVWACIHSIAIGLENLSSTTMRILIAKKQIRCLSRIIITTFVITNRLTTTGAARSVLMKFETKRGQKADGKQAWDALRSIRTTLDSAEDLF